MQKELIKVEYVKNLYRLSKVIPSYTCLLYNDTGGSKLKNKPWFDQQTLVESKLAHWSDICEENLTKTGGGSVAHILNDKPLAQRRDR